MSLLDRMSQQVTRLVPSSADDGEGGSTTAWSDGLAFKAAVARESAQEATVGGRVAQAASWALLCPVGTGLALGERVRLADGTVLRVTCTPQVSPVGAGIAAERVTAEEVRP